MKEILVGVFLIVATAAPGFAQAYCACWGTGNVMDQSLLEKSNGAYGYAMSVSPQDDAATSAKSRHLKHNRQR